MIRPKKHFFWGFEHRKKFLKMRAYLSFMKHNFLRWTSYHFTKPTKKICTINKIQLFFYWIPEQKETKPTQNIWVKNKQDHQPTGLLFPGKHFRKVCFTLHATSMLSRFGHLEGIMIFFQFFSWIDNIDFEQLRVSSEIFWELILLSEHILWCQSTFWNKISTIKSKTTTQEKTFFFSIFDPQNLKINFFFCPILLKKHGKSLPKKKQKNFEFFWKVKNTYHLWNYFFTV